MIANYALQGMWHRLRALTSLTRPFRPGVS
jgi:hypothetical protein